MLCRICGKEYETPECPYCGYSDSKQNDPHHLPVGSVLADGKYTIVEEVGAGGFGVTYVAWDKVLQSKVAIKEYMPGEFSTRMPGTKFLTVYGGEKHEQYDAGLEKFFDESRRLARFTDVSGIVQIYDCFKENNTAYIVMEYLKGETLDERIKREGKLPLKEALDFIIPVLDALEQVHKEGLVHRDVAPNNIVITEDGKVKLIDFGAARSATGSHSKSLTVMFKNGFTAEEQYRSNGVQGSWTDVYSTAATLYKVLTGVTPEGAMERRIKDNLKPPSKCGAKVSGSIDTAIMNAMNVTADRRTRTAAEFKKELEEKGMVKKHYVKTEERRTGKIPARVWIFGALGLVVAEIVIVLVQMGFFEQAISDLAKAATGRSMMPRVEGMEIEEVENLLAKRSINYEEIDLDYVLDTPGGWVKEQSVEKGEMVSAEDTVQIKVSGHPQEVEIPDLEGMDQQAAEVELSKLQYNVIVDDTLSSYELKGTVLKTDPPGDGRKYEQGKDIRLYVSPGIRNGGSGDYTVENLTNRNYEEFKKTLGDEYAIYLVKASIEYDENVEEGLILRQDKEAGTVLKAQDVIGVVVSGDKYTKMPKLTDLKLEEAQKKLEENNLYVATEAIKVTDTSKQGIVLSQDISANTNIERGSTINITYGLRSFEVPSLIGKTKEEAEQLCKELNIKVTSKDVRGGTRVVKAQSVKEKDLIAENDTLELSIGIPENDFDTEYRTQFYTLLNNQLQANGISKVQAGVKGNASPVSDTYTVADVNGAVAKAYNQIYQGHISNRRGIFSSTTVGVDIVILDTNRVTITYYQQDHLDGIDPSLYNG